MELKNLKESVRVKMLNGQIEELDLMACFHNLLMVITSKSWDRLDKKTYGAISAYNDWIEKLNNADGEANEQGGEKPTAQDIFPIAGPGRIKHSLQIEDLQDAINKAQPSLEQRGDKFKDDIQVIGNCANCGVEYHIHVEQREQPELDAGEEEKFLMASGEYFFTQRYVNSIREKHEALQRAWEEREKELVKDWQEKLKDANAKHFEGYIFHGGRAMAYEYCISKLKEHTNKTKTP